MSEKFHIIAPVLFLSLLVLGTILGTIISVKPVNAMTNQHGSGNISLDGITDEILGCSDFVYVSPEDVSDAKVGEVLTVTVGISGLVEENLYGFDILFTWSTDALEYVSCKVKVPAETYSDGVLHQPVTEIKNKVDVTEGTFQLAYASLLPAEPFNGDGVIFTISFVLLKSSDKPFAIGHAVLANNKGEIIGDYQIPEFTPVPWGSGGIEEYRALRMRRWLEWWITVTLTHG